MHSLGFAIVPERTEQALQAVMAPHEETYDEKAEMLVGHWDWWRAGGRWDGYLESADEMKARETHKGYNLAPKNQSIERNSCRAADVPPDRRDPFFFVTPEGWTARQNFNADFSRLDPVPDYGERLAAAMAAHPDHWVVVIDIHY